MAGNIYANAGANYIGGFTFTLNDLFRIKVTDTKVYFYKNSFLLGSQSTTPQSYLAKIVSGNVAAGQIITIDKVNIFSVGKNGTSGSAGTSGSNGGNGYAVSKHYYYANTGSTTGQFDVIGTANFNSITGIYINGTDYDGFSIGEYLQGILNSGETLEIQIKKITDASRYGIYRLNSATYSSGKLTSSSLTILAASSNAIESGVNYHLSFGTTIPTTNLSLSGDFTVTGTSSLNGLTVLQEVTEIINSNINGDGPGATASTVVYDFSTGSNWYHSSVNTNYTANFINIPTTRGRVITVTIVIEQGSTPYIPNNVQINGVSETIKWSGGTASGTPNQVDIVGFTFIRINSAWTQVLGQINTFD
jgi:hypothetical protein